MKYYSIATWYLCISIHFDSENLKPQLVKHLDSLVRFQGVGAGGGGGISFYWLHPWTRSGGVAFANIALVHLLKLIVI